MHEAEAQELTYNVARAWKTYRCARKEYARTKDIADEAWYAWARKELRKALDVNLGAVEAECGELDPEQMPVPKVTTPVRYENATGSCGGTRIAR